LLESDTFADDPVCRSPARASPVPAPRSLLPRCRST
jgi:hypothetical protein